MSGNVCKFFEYIIFVKSGSIYVKTRLNLNGPFYTHRHIHFTGGNISSLWYKAYATRLFILPTVSYDIAPTLDYCNYYYWRRNGVEQVVILVHSVYLLSSLPLHQYEVISINALSAGRRTA